MVLSGKEDDNHAAQSFPAENGEPSTAAADATNTTNTADTTDETGAETPKMAHDSMVTVRLSEPPTLTLDTTPVDGAEQDSALPSAIDGELLDASSDRASGFSASQRDSFVTISSTGASSRNLQDELGDYATEGSTESDDDQEEVDWEQLEKTEDEQVKDDETDNSTALLLARLEQENAKLATNPKSVKVQAAVERPSTSRPRPPSMAQLRQMVHGPTPPALRYSMLPPPPMTDLEFYAALVKDYQQTAARLPTLLSNKIRKGIPPPLRGVVWQSMSGARDSVLEEQYERFCGESSPYEPLIGKDLGRSFPGVDMFRDSEGDGQRMLGRVLKSFSLYDTKIGYCQGLAFLVGPLLMHMPDKQAFCVLVRLMERYDLRACFLPDLSGLHVRIYQFRQLLRQSLPTLSAHLDELQVETAYVSQWFLSFFAVTCPLPMLFRIYDVIFAEGASETLMRVALSLMRKNEERLLACTELEDVMQLLLSRGLWDCYHYDADEFVQDFVGLTAVVSRERLSQLEQGYRESLVVTANAARASDITTAATRFLGRIWASSAGAKHATLAPGLTAPSRPLSMLRRSASKQSIASTLNSIEASSASVASSSLTDATTVSRASSNAEDESSSRESTPVGPKLATGGAKSADERYLHSQIEDLLTALSELQRNHALQTNQLQWEREEREEDRKAVRLLLDGLRKRATSQDAPADEEAADDAAVDSATDSEAVSEPATPTETPAPSTEDLSELLDRVETRFGDESKKHRSSLAQSKSQLREELLTVKDQLVSAMSLSQELNRRIYDMNQEITSLKEQLRERHGHVRTLHQDNQRLEKQIHGLRTRASAGSAIEPSRETESEWPLKSSSSGGLREFKLGRSVSTPSHAPEFNKRQSSLPQPHEHIASSAASSGTVTPPNEQEALLLELVQAKTAEATAKQEAEEAKQKLEALRKAYGMAPGDSPGAANPTLGMGVFGRLTGHAPTPSSDQSAKPPGSTSGTPPAAGGFWGWRR
ncbi:GTPase activating protein [Purpureocillium lilacinum]|uniref:GTPase activating protein n=1 Tax=Purpureocillium lilacinum TaxID=33203 RepID=A0A179HZ88_PURLI|nr:GTPase activating protein [Purpureocillium lilacinum]OAQ86829.1 GTPase activating protein [Purpureocillium lilacinum]OAQ94798.1 GTPase activating protein [Purpureocillium lilacinum]